MTRPLPRLVVAPNGARRGKADHPSLPITLRETIETALACQNAGADGLHLHIRDEDGRHSLDIERYRAAITSIKAAAPDLYLQITSEAAGRYGADAQRAMIRALKPASVSVALREMLTDEAKTDEVRAFYHWAAQQGVAIQHIVYTPEELHWFLASVTQGIVPDKDHQLQLVLGSYDGDTPPRPGDLDAYLEVMGAGGGDLNFDWMVCAFGSAETACLAYAARCGGKVRVGFENSLWNANGSLAKDNAERVAEVRAAIGAVTQTLSPCER